MQHQPGILEIELSHQKSHRRDYDPDMVANCIGGRGFNVDYLYHHLPGDTRPFDPENILVMSAGLLTGGPAPAAARIHLNALSPLTGILGSSNIGGNLGKALAGSGIRSIIIRGAAPGPQYILIDNDRVMFCNAEELWGMNTWQAQDRLEELYKADNVEMMVIGPAGENLTRFASIISDRDHAFGRTGLGAVMGSKNLKAIVVRTQSHSPSLSNPIAVKAIRNYVKEIRLSPEFQPFAEYGGAGYVTWANDLGILATRNYRQNRFDKIEQIDGRKLRSRLIKSRGCRGCPVRCKAALEPTQPAGTGEFLVRPEFETMVNLGPKCGLSDLDALVEMDNICSRLGLDTISAGNVIAYAMDLQERGMLPDHLAGDLDLSWGQAETMITLLQKMSYHEGIGGLLSQGVKEMAEIIGNGSAHYAPHVKGLELAAYHPYNIMGAALGYVVSSRGGDFSNIYASMEYNWSQEKSHAEFGTVDAVNIEAIYGKAQLVKRAMVVNIALDCIGLCKVPSLSLLGKFDLMDEAHLVSAIAGETISAMDLFFVGERISNLERLFNLKFGAGPGDDRLPGMFFEQSTESSQPDAEAANWMQTMVDLFYEEMGWDEQGVPTPDTLSQLGI